LRNRYDLRRHDYAPAGCALPVPESGSAIGCLPQMTGCPGAVLARAGTMSPGHDSFPPLANSVTPIGSLVGRLGTRSPLSK
jgi:hypothetical protein